MVEKIMSEEMGQFEKQISRLEEVVELLEKGEVPLEQGIALFKEGSELAKSCRKQLQEAKHKVQVYSRGMLEEFEESESEGNEQAGD